MLTWDSSLDAASVPIAFAARTRLRAEDGEGRAESGWKSAGLLCCTIQTGWRSHVSRIDGYSDGELEALITAPVHPVHPVKESLHKGACRDSLMKCVMEVHQSSFVKGLFRDSGYHFRGSRHSQGAPFPRRHQASSHQIQVGQCEQGVSLGQVFGHAAVAYLGEAPQALDHVEGVLHPGRMRERERLMRRWVALRSRARVPRRFIRGPTRTCCTP